MKTSRHWCLGQYFAKSSVSAIKGNHRRVKVVGQDAGGAPENHLTSWMISV